MDLPKMRKNRQHDRPRRKQLITALRRTDSAECCFPAVLAALTAGSRTVLMDPVTAEGKRMQGRAMPVRTPYVRIASEDVIPYRMRLAGMEAASTLCRRASAVRFAVSGREKASSSRSGEKICEREEALYVREKVSFRR